MCPAMKSGTIKFILVSMGDSPDALTDKLYWRKAKGANGIASRSYPGTLIHLTLPTSGNLIRAWAANRPARCFLTVQLVRWTLNGAAWMTRLRPGFATASG
jgi:hypothetical protein